MYINDKAPAPVWQPSADRYNNMKFRRCGRSGVQLPELSLGLWHYSKKRFLQPSR